MRKVLFLTAVVFALNLSTAGAADWPAPWIFAGRSATVRESWLTGEARWMIGYGQYLKDEADAAVRQEQARAAARDNRVARIQVKRQEAVSYRQLLADNARNRPNKEALARTAHAESPRPLEAGSRSQDGRILWPETLRSDEFAAHRACFDSWATSGSTNERPNRAELARAHRAMVKELHGQISMLPSQDYAAAKKFLNGLMVASKAR